MMGVRVNVSCCLFDRLDSLEPRLGGKARRLERGGSEDTGESSSSRKAPRKGEKPIFIVFDLPRAAK